MENIYCIFPFLCCIKLNVPPNQIYQDTNTSFIKSVIHHTLCEVATLPKALKKLSIFVCVNQILLTEIKPMDSKMTREMKGPVRESAYFDLNMFLTFPHSTKGRRFV